MIAVQIPAGIILALMGGLIVAIPFATRPMSALAEARWSKGLLSVCALIIAIYAATWTSVALTA